MVLGYTRENIVLAVICSKQADAGFLIGSQETERVAIITEEYIKHNCTRSNVNGIEMREI
ncbi:MAG: hypothetical protein JSV38_03390 [Desulfobacterales bacterium]|nr:MAG: hypothetical protein JSV38_03390 [Desulfobacterales bacterium]